MRLHRFNIRFIMGIYLERIYTRVLCALQICSRFATLNTYVQKDSFFILGEVLSRSSFTRAISSFLRLRDSRGRNLGAWSAHATRVNVVLLYCRVIFIPELFMIHWLPSLPLWYRSMGRGKKGGHERERIISRRYFVFPLRSFQKLYVPSRRQFISRCDIAGAR